MDRTACVIPAAGLSVRMGSFKPLIELAGEPLICRTVSSALDAGCSRVCVVLGRQAPAVMAALDRLDTGKAKLDLVLNSDFAHSQMLASIQLGLRQLLAGEAADKPCAAVFCLPGDMPAIAAGSFQALLAALTASPGSASPGSASLVAANSQAAGSQETSPDTGARVCVPCYRGQTGHPVLLSRNCLPAVLDFRGQGGLRGALTGLPQICVEVDDPGILLDADTPQQLADLRSHLHPSLSA